MHIYERLGIDPVINGYEFLTMLGGSLMRPEVLQAMTEASQHLVRLDELQRVVGRNLPYSLAWKPLGVVFLPFL